jgi:hypothetical protein
MGWCPLVKGLKTETPRGKYDVLLDINRTNHQVLTMHIQSHKTGDWSMSCFCCHSIILLSERYNDDPGG